MAEDILIPLGGMVLSGWIIYTIIAGIQNWYQRRTQAMFQSKMLDKIGSVSELGTFLNTDAGIRFLRGLTSEIASPQIRILRGGQSGVVLASLGLGLYVYGWFSPARASGGDQHDERHCNDLVCVGGRVSPRRRVVVPVVKADGTARGRRRPYA